MTTTAVFSPRAMLGWLAAVVAAFALSIYFLAFSKPPERPAVGPSASSRSAIGFAGLAELIRRTGTTVTRVDGAGAGAGKSGDKSGGKSGNKPGTLVVLANPMDTQSVDDAGRYSFPRNAASVLIILPKWRGYPDPLHSGWITEASAVPLVEDDHVLAKAGIDGHTARVPRPETWTTNTLGITPELPAEVQVIQDTKLRPVIGAAGRVLLGEITEGNRRIWVAADPDMLANHGLFSGRNPELAVTLVDALAPAHGEVTFDEWVRGTAVPAAGNALTLMLQFPYIIVTLQLIAAAAFLLWAAMPRFGVPMPTPEVLAAGKQRLIDNAASLLRFSGHPEVVITSYVRLNVRSAARQLRSPPGLDWRQLVAWLTRVGTARGVGVDFADLIRRAEALATTPGAGARALVDIVHDTHRWKREILNGP